jgi:transposase
MRVMPPPPQRKELTEAQRAEIIGMWKCDKSYAAISRDLDVYDDTVRNVCKYYQETGLYIPPKRLGRETIMKDRDRRIVKRHVRSGKEERHEALGDITAKFNLNIAEDTLLKELAKMGLNRQVERQKPYLSPAQVKARLAFAKKYQHWGFEEWS